MTPESITVGQYHTIKSKILGEERKFIVHLPQNYETSDSKYPVVYVVNANYKSHFVHSTSTIDRMSDDAYSPQMIVIGTLNVDHGKDFFPFPIKDRSIAGEADRFLDFLAGELVPFIEQKYRTEPFRILYGQSNGGLFTIFSFLTRSEAFDAYIAGSPMLGWNTEKIQELARDFLTRELLSPKYLYMTYGSEDFPEVISSAPMFAALLARQKHDYLKWKSVVLEGVGHSPFSTLSDGLLFLFPQWRIKTDQAIALGLKGVIDFYKGLSQKYAFLVNPPASILLDVAFELYTTDRLNAAQQVAEYLVALHPHEINAHYLLGLLFQKRKDPKNALNSFQKMLALSPTDPRALKKVSELMQRRSD